MRMTRLRRSLALVTAAALLASLTAATVATPASAAKPKCQGFKATIVGTKKADVIRGTAKRDVIVAKGGADRIYGRGGNDIICAGGGNDLVVGGPGADRLWGQLGNDRLLGNIGPDFLAGQVGDDTLVGGIGVDTCFQGTGTGPKTRCERPAPPAPPAPPPGPSLIPLTGILAVAYSDVDGLDGYSTGDVLIARVSDANGNGEPDAGDTIEMGRYPTDFTATTFGDWLDRSHVVQSLAVKTSMNLTVISTDGHSFGWADETAQRQTYYESNGNLAQFEDYFYGATDVVEVATGSPSVPQTPVSPPLKRTGPADDAFIDVALNY